MGNTISEDLESSIESRWLQSQTRTTQQLNQNTNTMSNSNTNNTQNQRENTNSLIINTDNAVINQLEDDGLNAESIRRSVNEGNMAEFRAELANKHLARRQAIAERSREILFLREELAKYKKENEELKEVLNNKAAEEACHINPELEDTSWKEELEQLKTENLEFSVKLLRQQEEIDKNRDLQKQNHELRLNIAEVQNELQSVNSQLLDFEKERDEYQNHVSAMKEVVAVSKQLLEIRERQLEELRTKVSEIETQISEQETTMLSSNLRNEYEKQLRNMRALRTLYEQRQAAMKADRDAIAKELDEMTKKVEAEQSKSKELEERIDELEQDVSNKYDKLHNLESQLGFAKAECRGLQAEMSVINQLFSQILIGFNNGQVDLDKLIKLLEENHDLLKDIVINEESPHHSSTLPKTLLDLVNRVQEKTDPNEIVEAGSSEGVTVEVTNEETQPEQPSSSQMCSAAEIVHNLPKVWRVLAELLSQQSGQQPVAINESGMDPCYKSIETPKGPKLVLSVSQTFIRLKDLILEKKSLEKEMTRLKQLNTHLETRLQDQEKRLTTVSSELTKTWHVVGRMQRQHQQLHTHEQILRYELSQKRKMLTELKQELEYCREKWEQAREKNSNTEEQWKQLRHEFAARKKTTNDDLNNSAESGYSDERECSSDEDVSFSGSKKKVDDIESPDKSDTDNDEVSHESDGEDILESAFSKACSSGSLQQPQLTMPEVFVLGPETPEASLSNSGKNCDIIEANEKECNRVDVNLHSEECSKTDIEVQINDSTTQVQDGVLKNETKENDTNNNCHIYINLQKNDPNDVDITKWDFSTIEIPTELLEMLSKTVINHTSVVPTPPPLPPLPLFSPNDTKINVKKKLDNIQNIASCSRTDLNQMSSEERLKRREERLKRLEEQCNQLYKKVTHTTNRSNEICNKLEILHEQYGSTSEQENGERTEDAKDTRTEDDGRNTLQTNITENDVISEENSQDKYYTRTEDDSRNTQETNVTENDIRSEGNSNDENNIKTKGDSVNIQHTNITENDIRCEENSQDKNNTRTEHDIGNTQQTNDTENDIRCEENSQDKNNIRTEHDIGNTQQTNDTENDIRSEENSQDEYNTRTVHDIGNTQQTNDTENDMRSEENSQDENNT